LPSAEVAFAEMSDVRLRKFYAAGTLYVSGNVPALAPSDFKSFLKYERVDGS